MLRRGRRLTVERKSAIQALSSTFDVRFNANVRRRTSNAKRRSEERGSVKLLVLRRSILRPINKGLLLARLRRSRSLWR